MYIYLSLSLYIYIYTYMCTVGEIKVRSPYECWLAMRRPVMIQFSEGGSCFFSGKALDNKHKQARGRVSLIGWKPLLSREIHLRGKSTMKERPSLASRSRRSGGFRVVVGESGATWYRHNSDGWTQMGRLTDGTSCHVSP